LISEEARFRLLMMAALGGDQAAYRALLRELTPHLRGYYLRRLGPDTTEDAVQEVLIGIHTRRQTYDPSQPFTAWVYGIARYKLIDEYRRAKRRVTVPLDEVEELFAADETAAATAQRDVEKLLSKLPEAKRRLLTSVKLDGQSVADVARRTSMSKGAVKVAVHRALKSLSDELGDDEC
jgi:RNA polymerase sigma-70 factor, ECF subfamily